MSILLQPSEVWIQSTGNRQLVGLFLISISQTEYNCDTGKKQNNILKKILCGRSAIILHNYSRWHYTVVRVSYCIITVDDNIRWSKRSLSAQYQRPSPPMLQQRSCISTLQVNQVERAELLSKLSKKRSLEGILRPTKLLLNLFQDSRNELICWMFMEDLWIMSLWSRSRYVFN